MFKTRLLLFKFLQCQSKEEINQYSDPSPNVIFHNIKPKLSEHTVLFLLIPNMQFLIGGNDQKNRAKIGKKHNIPVIKEGIFLN